MRIPLWLHKLVIAILISLLTWVIIDRLIVELSLVKYFFVEVLLFLSGELYTFISSRLQK
jgi:hypothetical protein